MKKIVAILLSVLILSTLVLGAFADNGSTEPPAPTDVPSPTAVPTEPTTPTNPNNDNNNTSPNTGDNALLLVTVMMLGLAGVVIATKKLVKTN